VARFEDEHERLYGVRGQAGSPVQLRALRLAALGPSSPADTFAPAVSAPPEGASTRNVRFGDDAHEVPVRSRDSIGAAPEAGPLVVDEYDTTVVVRPGWTVRREISTSALILERKGGQ
jgi:N-methylhydantoinase A